MKSFLERHKSLLSIALTVTCSVLMVAFVVSAATTIGLNITTAGDTTVGGGVAATGTLSVGTSATVTATSTIYHGLALGTRTGYTAGVFTVDTLGNVVASGTLKVNGASTLVGNVGVTGGLAATGTLSVGTSGTVTATSTIYHGLELGTRTGYMAGVFTVDTLGNAVASGTLKVNGASTLVGNVGVTGGLAATGTLAIGTSATVTATSTIYHGLELGTRTGYMAGVFTVDTLGNAVASGTLKVNGASTLVGNVGVTGNASVTGGLATTGTLAVGTSATVTATSTIYHGLELGNRTGYTSGVFNVDTLGNVAASGTIYAATALKPDVNAGATIGAYSSAFGNVYASSTMAAFGGTNATTTLNIAATGGSGAVGSCLMMTGSNGTLYFLTVTTTVAAAPWSGLNISTVDCRN